MEQKDKFMSIGLTNVTDVIKPLAEKAIYSMKKVIEGISQKTEESQIREVASKRASAASRAIFEGGIKAKSDSARIKPGRKKLKSCYTIYPSNPRPTIGAETSDADSLTTIKSFIAELKKNPKYLERIKSIRNGSTKIEKTTKSGTVRITKSNDGLSFGKNAHNHATYFSYDPKTGEGFYDRYYWDDSLLSWVRERGDIKGGIVRPNYRAVIKVTRKLEQPYRCTETVTSRKNTDKPIYSAGNNHSYINTTYHSGEIETREGVVKFKNKNGKI